MPVVEPMDGELAMSHLVRSAIVAGQSVEQFLSDLQDRHCIEVESDNALSNHAAVLAAGCGISLQTYLRRHSLSEFHWGIHPFLFESQSDRMEALFGCEPMTSDVPWRVCADCMSDDLRRFGFFWLRRNHHLPGFNWCLEHRRSLFSATPREQKMHPVGYWLSSGAWSDSTASESAFPAEGGFISRYLEIATAILSREHPALSVDLKEVLRRVSGDLFELWICRNHRILDELNRTRGGMDWLREILFWRGDKPERPLWQAICLEGFASDQSSPGAMYALHLAACFRSADEAVEVVCASPRWPPKNALSIYGIEIN